MTTYVCTGVRTGRSPPLSPFISLLIQHVTPPVLVLAVVIHPHCLLSGASFTKTSFNILIDQILYLPDSPGSSPLCSASRFHSVRVALHDSQLWDVNKDHQLASLSVQISRETCAQSEHRYRCFDPCWWTRHLLLMFGRVSERRTTAQTVWDQEAQMPHLPADASSFWSWPVCDVNEAPALQLCLRTFYYLLLVFLYRARAAFPNESVGQVTRSSVVLFHCDALRKPDH